MGEINIPSAKISGASVDTSKFPRPRPAEEKAQKVSQAAQPKGSSEKPAQAAARTEKKETPKEAAKLPFDFILGELSADVSVDGRRFDISARGVKFGGSFPAPEGAVQARSGEYVFKASSAAEKKFARVKSILEGGGKTLAQMSAEVPADFSSVAAKIRMDIDNAAAAQFLPESVKLPDFALALYAELALSNGGENASVKIVADSKISKLSKLSESLAPLGEFSINARIDAEKSGEKIEVRKFESSISEGGEALAEISAKPFAAGSPEELENAELLAVLSLPSRIPEAFMPDSFKISAERICAKLSLKKRGGKYEVSTVSPLSLTDAKILRSGEIVASGLNLFFDLSAALGEKSEAKISMLCADSKTDKLELAADIKYDGKSAEAEVSGGGSLKPMLSRVRSVSLGKTPPMNFKLGAALACSQTELAVKRFNLDVSEAGGAAAAKIFAKSPLVYDFEKARLFPQSGSELIAADCPNFPFAAIKPFLAGVDAEKASFSGVLSESKSGEYAADFSVSASGLSYAKDGKAYARDLSVSAAGNASYNKDAAEISLKNGRLGAGGAEFCTFSGGAKLSDGFAKIVSANVSLETALAPIFAQPALLKYSNISRGTAEISASYGGGETNLKIAAHSVSTRTAAGVLDKVQACAKLSGESVFANVRADSKLGHSDASLTCSESGGAVSAKLEAKSLVLEDALALAGAFSNPTYSEETAPNIAPQAGKSQRIVKPSLAVLEESKKRPDEIAKRDKKAFWNVGKNVSLKVSAQKLLYKNSLLLEGFKADASASPELLELRGVSGKFMGADISAGAQITFSESAKIPYELKPSSISLKSFEASKIFFDSAKPAISGLFDADIRAESSGNNAEHLLQCATGKASIRSRSAGALRILDSDTIAGGGAALAGGILKLAGKILKNKVAELDGMGDVVGMLSKAEFSEAAVEMSRKAPDYNYN
ncbi:MAG: hypothetical protein IJI37_01210, partial [Opitutales bacterium]|nr:hypothetical protein [Opitutales bacterium]